MRWGISGALVREFVEGTWGDNLFLFTFLQPARRRRVIEDGPWEFGGDLLIVREFDEDCQLEELKFVFTPMWIRVHRLPIGLMNTET